MNAGWLRELDGAIELTLHVQPGSRTTAVDGVHGGALKVRLAAAPVDGRANALLLRFIADAYRVPLRQVTLVRGTASRRKVVRVDSPAARPDRVWSDQAVSDR